MNEEKQYNSKSIKSWAVNDRPREKMMLHGAKTLSDAELIGIIFANGTKDKSAIDIARELLNMVNNDIDKLAKCSLKEMQKIDGIGPAKAIALTAALELGRRRAANVQALAPNIQSSKDAFEILHPLLQDLNHEVFMVLYLNTRNAVIHQEIISQGGINTTVVDHRIILKHALEHLATGIILAHNHPSGNLQASNADIAITNKIFDSCKILDIKLLDHLIIGHRNYLSFSDTGLL